MLARASEVEEDLLGAEAGEVEELFDVAEGRGERGRMSEG